MTPTVQALSRAIQGVAQAFQPVGDRLSAEACRAYRQHHRRLPDSRATTRLRKKRQQRVMTWWLRR